MISGQNIASLIGADVTDADGSKIGTVGQIYVDPGTGRPNWATVKTGFFGTSESFVPLDQADDVDGELRVPYTKDFVKDAPRIDDHADLSDDEENLLYHHYQGPDRTASDTARPDIAADGSADPAEGFAETTQAHDTSGPAADDSMIRSEERLHVGTERVEVGRARLRKYVVTEERTVTVPVSREEVRIEREPARSAYDPDEPARSQDDRHVVLSEERPVIAKEAVPVERVRLGTESVTGTEDIDAEVRKEEIELEGDTGATRR